MSNCLSRSPHQKPRNTVLAANKVPAAQLPSCFFDLKPLDSVQAVENDIRAAIRELQSSLRFQIESLAKQEQKWFYTNLFLQLIQ